MIIILYLTIGVLTQSLSLTYKLPNKILAWVGGQQMEGIEAIAIQQITSVVTQQQGSALRSVQQAGMAGKNNQVSQQGAQSGVQTGSRVGKN